jgi:predicted nucleic acid-binding protein
MNYLLDTNHASWLMAQRDTIVTRMRQAQADGARFGVSVTVLGEHLTFVDGITIENWRV